MTFWPLIKQQKTGCCMEMLWSNGILYAEWCHTPFVFLRLFVLCLSVFSSLFSLAGCLCKTVPLCPPMSVFNMAPVSKSFCSLTLDQTVIFGKYKSNYCYCVAYLSPQLFFETHFIMLFSGNVRKLLTQLTREANTFWPTLMHQHIHG